MPLSNGWDTKWIMFRLFTKKKKIKKKRCSIDESTGKNTERYIILKYENLRLSSLM